MPRVLMSTRGRLGSYGEALERVARRALREAAMRAGLGAEHELSLILCDNPWIQKINRRWRGMDRPTDVLAFPLHELKEGQIPPAGPVGDVVVSLPTVRRAARELGVPVEAHLKLLLVHGLLHLLGYNHDVPARARRMARRERELLGPESEA